MPVMLLSPVSSSSLGRTATRASTRFYVYDDLPHVVMRRNALLYPINSMRPRTPQRKDIRHTLERNRVGKDNIGPGCSALVLE